MRALLVLAAIGLLPFAAGGYPEPEPFGYCPEYEIVVGTDDAYTAATISPDPIPASTLTFSSGHYVVQDFFYVQLPWSYPATFSLWLYGEGNGMPGLQRDDDVCDHGIRPADIVEN